MVVGAYGKVSSRVGGECGTAHARAQGERSLDRALYGMEYKVYEGSTLAGEDAKIYVYTTLERRQEKAVEEKQY